MAYPFRARQTLFVKDFHQVGAHGDDVFDMSLFSYHIIHLDSSRTQVIHQFVGTGDRYERVVAGMIDVHRASRYPVVWSGQFAQALQNSLVVVVRSNTGIYPVHHSS